MRFNKFEYVKVRLLTVPLDSKQRSIASSNTTFHSCNIWYSTITFPAKWYNQRTLGIKEGKVSTPKRAARINWEESLCDGITTGGCTVKEVSQLKTISVSTFQDAGLQLHKWNSNRAQLENKPVIKQADRSNQTYVKQQPGVKPNETKILWMHLDKKRKFISVSFPEKTDETKRGILKFLASVFDPLGIVSPLKLCGKIL